jgi:hypothetical protein
MPEDLSLRVRDGQLLQERGECGDLRGGAGVLRNLRLALGETADVADAERARVVPLDVGSWLVVGTALLDRAIELDDVVVADLLEAALAVPAVDVGCVKVLALAGGRTVNDNEVDASDWFVVQAGSIRTEIEGASSHAFSTERNRT